VSEPAPPSRLAAWQQDWPLTLTSSGAYLLLAALTGLTLPWREAHSATLPVDVSLCAFLALWIFFMHTLCPAWRLRAGHMTVFVAGLNVILIALVHLDPWFGFFTVAGYGFSMKYLPWPRRLFGVAGTGMAAAISQTSGITGNIAFHVAMFILALILNAAAVSCLTWFLWVSDKQDHERKHMLAELNTVNERLLATIAENEELHQRLLVQAREAGILDERSRMAREIHDTLAQGLTGIVTQLQAAEQAAGHPARWRRHLTAATQLARESLTEARRSVHALRPEPLEKARLGEALAGVAERWSATHGIPVQVTTTGAARPIDPEAEFALLRAAQEALANVARHARATRVGLTVSYMDSEVALDVRDDGIGFEAGQQGRARPDRAGFGLVAMRQRIEALAGTLQVESEPGGGTAISACVPTGPTAPTTPPATAPPAPTGLATLAMASP
jgi:signal transduction histidine kinase